ncbi:Rhomboid-related protein 4 [Geodia barretti]|uniref:Rhomboid-related protein 4 n=1 Tax=Geodia barretti TaxID=519541 RepID=A0AA35W0X1_GEOBA|nr:Rhomboid-related protein 4 [Geodia barretti]
MDQWSYINSCAVGFSGVLFALKVVTTHIQPAGMTRVMGFIPVPMRIACWVELVLISVLFPHVSFIGHLAGILIGFAFVYGPLQTIMNIPLSLLTGTLRSFELLDFDGALPDVYRKLAIVGVGLFMIFSPILLDFVPSHTAGGGTQYADGHSYTYRSGTTGRRGAEQQQRNHPPPQPSARPYHSYTYAAGPLGRGDGEGSEEAELQEAIRRSLSTDSSGESRRTEERENGTQSTVDEGLREERTP